MGHWVPKCHGDKPLQPRNVAPAGSQQVKPRHPPSNLHLQGWQNRCHRCQQGPKPQDQIALHSIQPYVTTAATTHATGNTKGALTHDELSTNTINHGSIRNTHPKEIVVGDVHAPQRNEAYTTIQLPASASRRGTASLHVKVNNRAGGNILLLHVFWHLYPNQISPGGLSTGLDHVSTQLTTYNRSHIPLYSALHGPITWQPGHPGAWPHGVNLYWYIADTPGPAILGLPSSEKLAVIKMNCAITVMWPGTKPPMSCTHFHNSSHDQACYSPWSSQVHQVHWWLDQGVPRSIHGHWQIPWQIQDLTPSWCPSCDTCPQEMPQCLAPKGQGTPQQDGMSGCDHPCRWTNRLGILHYLCSEGKWWAMCVLGSPWPQWDHLPQSSQDAHWWGKSLMSLHTLASSPSWMPTVDTWQLSSTRTPACLQQSTVPLEDITSCDFP